MADNFNLRAFLTENKLTKNAQLLKEEVSFNGKPVDISSIEIDGIDPEDYPDFADAYITYAEYEDGTPLTDEELHDFEAENYALVSELIHDNQLYLQEEAPSAGMTAKEKSALVKKAKHGGDIGHKGAGFEKIEKAAEKKYGSKEAGEKVAAAAMWKNAAKHEGAEGEKETIDENIDVIAQLIDMFPFLTNSTAQMLLGAFGAAGLTSISAIIAKVQEMALKGTFGEKAKAFATNLQQSGRNAFNVTQQREAVQETLTAKERRLVEMVEKALEIKKESYHDSDDLEDNVSNDAAYEKAFDTMDESEISSEPLPTYENIEKLMQEIEHGTNKASHEYKMNRMKEVAEMLENKVTSLEEGEHAEHIDQKAVKQMRKDIATLRKAEEKLRKEFDKKFAEKKEKKETK